jgi:hypothetical protein
MDIYLAKPSFIRITISKLRFNQRWLNIAVPAAVFVLAFLPRILKLDAFLTADEDDQIMFAHLFLKSALQGDWAGALVLGYPGVPTLILGAIGVGLRYWFHYIGWLPLPWVTADLMTTIDQVTTRFGVFEYPLDFLLWVRVPMALLTSLGVVGIYWLTKRLVEPRLALIATLIIAFDPFILAHSRVIHVDAPLSFFMFLSFLAFLLFLDKGAWKWLLLSGLFGGLAGLSKTPAALLGPILVVSGILYAVFPPAGQPRSVRWKRLVLAVVGWGIIAAAAFAALWPSMWTRPQFAIRWIIRNIQSVNSISHPTTGIFWEEWQSDQNPFYYLIVFPYHLTPLTTLGLLAGLAMIVVGLVIRWRQANSHSNENWAVSNLPLALGLVTYVVVFVAPVSAISRRGDRYILPVFFASGLLSALALWWLAPLVKRFLPKFLGRFEITPTWIIAVAVLVQTFFVLLYHPYYLAYFNPVVGGAQTAPHRVNIGWGEGLDLAAKYLNEITGPQKPQVAAWYSGQFAPYYQGQTTDLSNQSSALTGEYTVLYINQIQRGFPSGEILDYFQEREPLHIVKIGGIDYAWIYEGPVISQKAPSGQYIFPVEALLGGGAQLIGVDVPQTTMPADTYSPSPEDRTVNSLPYGSGHAGLPVTIYWETVGRIHGEHNLYIRLVDDHGHAWGQVDRMILGGLWRPDRWQPGYFLRDEYKLPIDPATPPGIYHLEVGMYDFVTGQSYGVARNIGHITLTPPERLTRPEELNLETVLGVAINNSITLVGHTYLDQRVPAGSEVVGKLFWQATKPNDKDYQVEFSLLAPNIKEYVIAEMPLSSTYPTSKWRRSELVGAAYRFHIPAVAPAGDYPLLINLVDPHTGERVGPATQLATVTVEARERNFDLPQDVVPISAVLGDEIELVGYKLNDQTVAPRETFGLTLYWRSLRLAEGNYTTFVHAVGPDQVMRGQWDSVPGAGSSPTSGWIPGEIIEDHYEVPMAKDAPPWKYDIFVGMYDSLTGERLQTFSQNAPVSNNRIWLTRVQVAQK